MTHVGTLRSPACIYDGRHSFGATLLTSWLILPLSCRGAHKSFHGVTVMPFVCLGVEPLTEKIALRLQPAEQIALISESAERGMSVSALVRQLYFGKPVVGDVNRELVLKMIRLGAAVRSAWDDAVASAVPHNPHFVEALVDLQRFVRGVEKGMTRGCVHFDRFSDAIHFDEFLYGREALSVIVTFRILPEEKSRLLMDAEMAGITASALIRRRVFGRPVPANINRVMQRRTRQLMGMLHHFIGDQRCGAYPELHSTRSALSTLFGALGHDLKTRP